jgi:signal peptidase I
MRISNHIKLNKKEFTEALSQILIAILIALLFRSFFFEPYQIPSGSMKPTLIIGDCVVVSKYSYGYSRYSLPLGVKLLPESRILQAGKPERGDVIIFRGPSNTSITYIKRLIGLPGDRIQVIDGIVYINAEEVKRISDGYFYDLDTKNNVAQYIETLPNGVSYKVLDRGDNYHLDNTQVFIVPENSYFFMGDNRDNSADSRVLEGIGYVDEKFLIGKAQGIFFSAKSSIVTLWNFFMDIDFSRFFISLIPEGKK